MKKHLSLLFASGLYIGLIPGAPGTYGSIAATMAFYLVSRVGNGIVPALHLSVTCLVSLVGIFAAAEVSRQRGEEDPRVVVIDEIAGQLVTYLFLPVRMFNLLGGLMLFRIFDIWKPFPIRRLESLPNGVGIMADDLLAGVYANVILQFLNWLPHR
ncbi:MAG TPA: phosphatidylglycerophosphatase A [Acidobacteriota bacterium]|nr:phosphatidylglycerophosphatase A [Acidobacteriota bacterium]